MGTHNADGSRMPVPPSPRWCCPECQGDHPFEHCARITFRNEVRCIVPQRPQRQDALNDQLSDLVWVAHRLGMYDAADFIVKVLETKG
jgi:hypothetical protein